MQGWKREEPPFFVFSVRILRFLFRFWARVSQTDYEALASLILDCLSKLPTNALKREAKNALRHFISLTATSLLPVSPSMCEKIENV